MEKTRTLQPRQLQNLGLSAHADQSHKNTVIRIVITHTDFRIYWPSRIAALQQALHHRGDELHIIEIAGSGSPYAFSKNHDSPDNACRNWTCLFPDTAMEDITPTRASKQLLAKLDELNPDLVMAGSIAFPSGAAAVRWAKKNDRPVIMFDDARPQDVPRNPLVNYIKQLIYRQVDAILCPAHPWKRAFARWHFQPGQIFYGVDVIDNEYFSHPLPAKPGSYFLAVGRQIPVKNFGLLLEAYHSYRTQMPPDRRLPLVMIGDGPQRQEIETYIKTHDLTGEVRLYPFLSQKILRTFYHHAAALILPSTSETWGLVVNEAMAAGLPLILSNACGCAEVLLEENINGYSFSPDNPDQLLQALISFTNLDDSIKTAMGLASQRIIRPWGLDRFVQGSLEAIAYAMTNHQPCRSIGASFVLRQWKGRYRPI